MTDTTQTEAALDAHRRWEQRFAWLRWVDRISLTLGVIGGFACAAMMLHIVIDVIGRTFWRSLPGTLDVTQFAWMPTIIALGFAYALLAGTHIRIGLLTDSANERTQRIVEVVAMAATAFTVALFAWYGIEQAMLKMAISEATPATAWLPIWAFRWVLVVGLIAFMLQAIAKLIRAATVPVFTADEDDEFADFDAGSTFAEEAKS